MALARHQFTVANDAGDVLAGAHVEVRREVGGSPLASLYSDRAGASPITNPFDANAQGFAAFHCIGGAPLYVRVYTGPSGAPTFEQIHRYVPNGLMAEQDLDISVTTITASGDVAVGGNASFGAGGTSVASRITFNGASGIAAGFYHQWNKNGIGKWQQGFVNGTSDNMAFYRVGSPVHAFQMSVADDAVSIGSTTQATSQTTGALKVAGGISAEKDIFGAVLNSKGSGASFAMDDRALGASRGWVFYATGGAFAIYSVNGTANRLTIDDTTGAVVIPGTLSVNSNMISGGYLLSNSASGGVGYATGAGGTVTQATSKATAVTLNKATGAITMNNAALAAGAIVSFVLNDSAIAATDQIVVTHESGGTLGAYTLNGRATGAGTAEINVRNNTAGSLSEALVLRFSVKKSVNS